MNGGLGVGWTVEVKLNRKKEKNWIPTGGGGVATPYPFSWGSWASAGRPFSFELTTLGEKVCYCQSMPSDFELLGAIAIVFIDAIPPRYSRWRQFNLKSQMFHSNLPPLRMLQ